MSAIRYPVRVTTTTARGGYKLLDADQHEICYGYRHHQMAEIAAALNAAHDMRWRTVAEEAPERGVLVLIVRGGCQVTARFSGCEWHTPPSGFYSAVPTDLWHPLPTPPETEVGR